MSLYLITLKIEYTNYDGDWGSKCPFCGKTQKEHQVDLGTLDGIKYIHRQPCEPEKKVITKTAIKQANTIRFVASVYELGVYLWNKIPFKEEITIGLRFLKRLYVGVRGWLYFKFKYGKKK